MYACCCCACRFELCAADGVRSDGELEGSRSGDCGGAIAVDCVDAGKGRAAVAEPDTVRALGLHRDVLCWGLSSVLGAVKVHGFISSLCFDVFSWHEVI